jgi:hypothetical protein
MLSVQSIFGMPRELSRKASIGSNASPQHRNEQALRMQLFPRLRLPDKVGHHCDPDEIRLIAGIIGAKNFIHNRDGMLCGRESSQQRQVDFLDGESLSTGDCIRAQSCGAISLIFTRAPFSVVDAAQMLESDQNS